MIMMIIIMIIIMMIIIIIIMIVNGHHDHHHHVRQNENHKYTRGKIDRVIMIIITMSISNSSLKNMLNLPRFV